MIKYCKEGLMTKLPKLELFYNPTLYFFSTVETAKHTDCIDTVINQLHLSEEQINLELTDGSNSLKFRLTWVIKYLIVCGLLERPKRGYISITEEGNKLLEENLNITTKFLKERYPDFNLYHKKSNNNSKKNTQDDVDEEISAKYEIDIDDYYSYIEDEIIKNLFLSVVNENTVTKGNTLENITKTLFQKMGYYKVEVTGKFGDGGVDGHFAIDIFGLQKIAFQCKFLLRKIVVFLLMMSMPLRELLLKKALKKVFS